MKGKNMHTLYFNYTNLMTGLCAEYDLDFDTKLKEPLAALNEIKAYIKTHISENIIVEYFYFDNIAPIYYIDSELLNYHELKIEEQKVYTSCKNIKTLGFIKNKITKSIYEADLKEIKKRCVFLQDKTK